MTNPWLEIPLTDYEGHMSLPGIEQAQLLADELESAVRLFGPTSVAVIGCAGGNGFDRLADSEVQRVVGIDVNPSYIEAARRRYAKRLPGLELVVADIQRPIVNLRPVDLVFAALILEYVDLGPTFESLRTLCNPNGKLVIVSQAVDQDQPDVSPSPYTALQALAPFIQIRTPGELLAAAGRANFGHLGSKSLTSASGKMFTALILERHPD